MTDKICNELSTSTSRPMYWIRQSANRLNQLITWANHHHDLEERLQAIEAQLNVPKQKTVDERARAWGDGE